MKEPNLKNKQDYSRAVCMFLAEGMRTRKITLERALEIAEKILQNINLLDSEYDFLKLIKELSIDFEELARLEKQVSTQIKSDERTKTELLVKDYVIHALSQDMNDAVKIMDKALNAGPVTLEQLKQEFPNFKKFLENAKS